MSIFPVIGRELRSQARQPLTYMLRFLGALAVFAAFGLAFWEIRSFHQNLPIKPAASPLFENFGMALFGKLNFTIFLAIWIFAPLASADAISRERREGTLPLLRLTKLRSWEIVFGKSFVHMLRSSSLFLTMLPWLLIPALFGGVGPKDFLLAFLLDLSALFLALSAGLLASTFSRDWIRSVMWAEALALILFAALVGFHGSVVKFAILNGSAPAPAGARMYTTASEFLYDRNFDNQSGLIKKNQGLLDLATNRSVGYVHNWFRGFGGQPQKMESKWQQLWTGLNPYGQMIWLSGAAGLLVLSLGAFACAIALGAAYVERSWRDAPERDFIARFRQKYFKPRIGVARLKGNLNRSLDRNPIGWLHHYSPSARLTKWGWCLFLILVELFFATNADDLYAIQQGLGFFLVLGVLFSSTGSFRTELESGAFELLLVTPIREGQIFAGRVRGIWHQFLPAFLVYGAGFLFLASGWSDDKVQEHALNSLSITAILFFTAPLIGLYFSLKRWNFLVAYIAACIATVGVPFLSFNFTESPILHFLIAQGTVALLFSWRTAERLKQRLTLTARS
ncbi:MAG: ABC transporter permease [Verrucomicrobiales bacterium]